MIANLHIQNIGIIDDISIDFNEGFNVLTGETGAGKTLIIDSLAIIAGGRFSKEMIRRGQDHSFVEACLYMPNHLQAVDGNIIVTREIYTNGRNMCKINGRMVTVNELKSFMKEIIDIHGQHDNQTILEASSHIEYLDSFSGNELEKIKKEYDEFFYDYQQLKQKLKENYGDEKEKQRKLDLLSYQINEIEEANLKLGEEEELENNRNKMLNAEKICDGLNKVEIEVGENAIDSISNAIKAMEKIENLDSNYEEKLNTLKSIYYDLQELTRDITFYKDDIDFNEQERQQIETRLDLIFSLKRKYGNTIEEILNYKEEICKEVEKIENLEEYIYKLKNKQEEIKNKMLKLAGKMHEIRKENAQKLEEQINKQLQDLEMKNAKMHIHIDYSEQGEFTPKGLDVIEFFIQTNIGEDAKSLIKIASGGEMSRIMLAIKNVLADVDKVPILIFDEIDTGISGIAANRVSEKMKQIARMHQVLCVTHLAPIAAKGDYHYYISKEVLEDQTKTKIELLNEERSIEEIARIASGNTTKVALNHAIQLKKS